MTLIVVDCANRLLLYKIIVRKSEGWLRDIVSFAVYDILGYNSQKEGVFLMLNVAVIDAQGGGLGAAIVKSLYERYGESIRILALGTNAAATSAMKKSGAVDCATGENAITFNAKKADVIMGGIGIIAASGILGEITPAIAVAVAESPAVKILIPISSCKILIAGTKGKAAKDLIENAVSRVEELL